LWSLLLTPLFHITGIHAIDARALAFLFTVGTVLVSGALISRAGRPHLAAVTMILTGASPVLFFFSRLAILEPALLFFLTAAALAACPRLTPGQDLGTDTPQPASALRGFLCGLLLTLAMLTKTSAIFVMPAVFFLLWFPYRALWAAAAGRNAAFRALAIPALTFAVCYGAYWLLVIHAHPVDIHVFYHETSPSLGLQSLEKAARVVYRSITWLDPILFPALLFFAVVSWRRIVQLARDPLFGFAILFYLGYAAFMVLHFDAEPHYFTVLAVPMVLLIVLLLDAIRSDAPQTAKLLDFCILLALVVNLGYDARLLAHPEYTLRDAAMQIRSRIQQDANANRLVIGHGAIETTLFNQVRALDDLGSMSVPEKMDLYRPGWIVVWSTDTAVFQDPSVTSRVLITSAGRFPAMDNPKRDALLLYSVRYQ
jgi:4-amino-4-deoxy-L-arabinose transferase-like glycosyltransferase